MDDIVDFRWLCDPPDLIDGERVKYGDTRRYSRDRARRWADAGHGYIIEPSAPVAETPTEDTNDEGEGEDMFNRPKERFTWLRDAPALGIKAGEVQMIPRDISHELAQRYATAGHGRIDRLEKPQRQVDFTWRSYQHQCYGVMGIQPGQTTKVPEREARRMELFGMGNIGKTLKPYIKDDNAIREFYREEAARIPEDQRPPAVLVDYNPRTGRAVYAPNGWVESAGVWG